MKAEDSEVGRQSCHVTGKVLLLSFWICTITLDCVTNGINSNNWPDDNSNPQNDVSAVLGVDSGRCLLKNCSNIQGNIRDPTLEKGAYGGKNEN